MHKICNVLIAALGGVAVLGLIVALPGLILFLGALRLVDTLGEA